MAKSKYRKEIEGLIESLNKKTGMNYTTNFAPHYGGWNLYQKDSHGGQHACELGFYSRISSKEMVYYLEGVLNALSL
jgi:hypothetical protein